jgi:hypothetical protein
MAEWWAPSRSTKSDISTCQKREGFFLPRTNPYPPRSHGQTLWNLVREIKAPPPGLAYGGRPFVESGGHSRGLILPRHEMAQRTKSETRVRSLAYARKWRPPGDGLSS